MDACESVNGGLTQQLRGLGEERATMPVDRFVTNDVRSKRIGARKASMNCSAIEALEDRRLLAVMLPEGFEQTLVTKGLNTPTAMVFTPDGRILVTEKSGAVRVVTAGGKLLAQPLLTVATDIYRERGLDGIVLDPDFDKNGQFYLYYTTADPAKPNQEINNARNRLSRFTVSSASKNQADAGSERILLDGIASRFGIHNGGAMQFGANG